MRVCVSKYESYIIAFTHTPCTAGVARSIAAALYGRDSRLDQSMNQRRLSECR